MNGKLKQANFKPIVFFPPFILLVGAVVLSFANMDVFTSVMNGVNNWLFLNFGWLYDIGTLITVVICFGLLFSKFGNVKIGGSQAKPLLSPFKWWAVSLCVTIAIGLLFWAGCEPMFHLTAPPESLHIAPNSPEAAIFAMSTEFLHWGFSVYGLFTVPALMFAFAYYNMRKPYCFGSTLYPVLGERSYGKIGEVIDSVCIFVLVAGMAASLGLGILSVSGGLNTMFGIKTGPVVWLVVDAVIVVTFVLSAITGITNGVKWLSDFNAKIFIGMLVFIMIVGPTAYSLNLGSEALGNYITHFFEKSLFTGASAGDTWPQGWSIFYWAANLAWTPVMAVFLGQIGVGYKVKHFILVNFITPSIFGIIWMIFFGGGAIHMVLVEKLDMASVVINQGAEMGIYYFFSHTPFGHIFIPVFVFCMFLSFVTGSDAMTTAIGGMCSTGISPESPEPRKWLKIVWGALLGSVAWIMISFKGVAGVKMIGTFGGFPALLLELVIIVALVFVALNPRKYDTFKEDYNDDGSYKLIGKSVENDLPENKVLAD